MAGHLIKQKHCHLCGVSFNISHVRTANEPCSAAWEQNYEGFITGHGGTLYGDTCTPNSGCKLVRRLRRESKCDCHPLRDPDMPCPGNFLPESDDEDSDFEYQSQEDDEPLEYDSDDGDQQLKASTDGDDALSQERLDAATEYRRFCDLAVCDDRDMQQNKGDEADVFKDLCAPTTAEDYPGDFDDSDDSDDIGDVDEPDHTLGLDQGESAGPKTRVRYKLRYRDEDSMDHIAGPGCVAYNGYNGNNVTAEEMAMSNTLQCLVRKDEHWTLEPDDEIFERGGQFLSGLSDSMPSRDSG
jgi:hypothetical protein